MDKKITYVLIAAVLIIVVAGVAVFATGDDKDDAKDPDVPVEPTGDTYYLFLDGISADKIGWYTGVGSNPEEGYRNALENSKIPYTFVDGKLDNLDGNIQKDNMGYGIFANTSVNVAEPARYTFLAGPALNHVYSNVAYVVFSEWTWTAEAGLQYKLNPNNTTAESFLTGGPFADKDYKPLDYGNTYSIFLDGMGDLSGWYTGTGDNALLALDNALSEKKIVHDFNLEKGSLLSIESYVQKDNLGFGIFTYIADEPKQDQAYCFLAGPPMDDIAGNIAYVTFSEWTWNAAAGAINYAVNPSSPATEGFLTGGPFATA